MANRLRGDTRFGKRLGVWCACVLALVAVLAVNLWFRSAPEQPAAGVSLNDLQAAYGRVVAGQTQAPDLARLGFDASRPGVRRLSYLGLMEYFAPRDSGAFDRLDPAARQCLATPDGCRAYVFHLARRRDSGKQVAFGFVNAAEAAGANAAGVDVMFLVHDGRVAYKAMSGA